MAECSIKKSRPIFSSVTLFFSFFFCSFCCPPLLLLATFVSQWISWRHVTDFSATFDCLSEDWDLLCLNSLPCSQRQLLLFFCLCLKVYWWFITRSYLLFSMWWLWDDSCLSFTGYKNCKCHTIVLYNEALNLVLVTQDHLHVKCALFIRFLSQPFKCFQIFANWFHVTI